MKLLATALGSMNSLPASLNQEFLSQTSLVNTIMILDHTSRIRAMRNCNETMDRCKQELAQLRLEVATRKNNRRKDEMRGSALEWHFEQDIMERQWLVKSCRGIDDKVTCPRAIDSPLGLRSSGSSCPAKTLVRRNILLILWITFEALCLHRYPGYRQEICRYIQRRTR